MTRVVVSPSAISPTHDISLSSDGETFGLILNPSARGMQSTPYTLPAATYDEKQESWISGRGRLWLKKDPAGYWDSKMAWTFVDGRVLPCPAFNYATNLRNTDSYLSNSKTFVGLFASGQSGGATLYLSQSFLAGATYNVDSVRLFIKRVGTPGTLTVELCTNLAGNPGAVQKTVTKTTADITDYLTEFVKFTFPSVYGITSGSIYHIKVYGASTDNADNHWEVGVDTSTSSALKSTNNSTWSSASFKLNYRVADADVKRKIYGFVWDGAKYFVTSNDDGTASKLYIMGDRGVATSGTTTALNDTAKSWATNIFAGAYVWIHSGAGDGQVRKIQSNSATQIVPETAFTVAPTTTSRYIIFGTNRVTEITGHGLGRVVSKPYSINKVAIFPQGDGVNTRKGNINGSSYQWGAITESADYVEGVTSGKTLSLYFANAKSSTIRSANASTYSWGDILTFGAAIPVGTSDYRITNMIAHGESLYVLKQDGIFITEGGVPRRLGVNMSAMPSLLNGNFATVVENYLYVGFAGSVERVMGAAVSDVMNFKQSYDGMPAGRRSDPVTGENLIAQMFVGMDGGGHEVPSVLAWTDMGWMEVFRGFENTGRIRTITFEYGPELRPRLWIEYDGDLLYQDYAYNPANPLQDSTFNYFHEWSLTTGIIDARDPTVYKIIHDLEIMSENLGTYCKFEIDYQTNEEVGGTTWRRFREDVMISPRQVLTWDFGKINTWRLRIRAYTTSSTVPPILNAYRFTGWKIEPVKYQWGGQFIIGHGNATKTGEADHDPDKLEAWLKEQAVTMNKLTLRSLIPGDDNKVVTVSAPSMAREKINNNQWQGVMSLLFREL